MERQHLDQVQHVIAASDEVQSSDSQQEESAETYFPFLPLSSMALIAFLPSSDGTSGMLTQTLHQVCLKG